MRTRQGTSRGYGEDGFPILRGCKGWRALGTAWVPCESAVYSLTSVGHLTPAEARRGVRVLRSKDPALDYLWYCTPPEAWGQLCEECAKAWRVRLEVMKAEADADDVCGECAGLRGQHEWTCSKRQGAW